jgi:tripartite-type tricarboxylate transporter receptor subunit TctC
MKGRIVFQKLVRCITVGLMACTAAQVSAQPYPSRPVRIIVPFGPGAPDTVGRLLAQALSTEMGQPFIVENKPGANGIIGTQTVATAAPDGYILLVTSTSIVVNPSVQKNLPYDLGKDIVPVTKVAVGEALILGVNPSVPAKSAQELVALAKNPSSKLSYGSPGVGNTLHLATELFKARTGARMEHVPYKGAGPAIAALLSGEIQVMIMTPPLSLAHIRAGKIRPLAYTHTSRASFLPDVPTMREAGISGMEVDGGWYGLFTPAGTPPAIVERLQAATRKGVHEPKIKERFEALALAPAGDSPAEFRKFFNEQIKAYAEMVRIAGIQPE